MDIDGENIENKTKHKRILQGDVEMDVEEVAEDEEQNKALQGLKFRNYLPRDAKLREHMLKNTNDPAQIRTDILKKFDTLSSETLNPLTLAPKKPNWDLKRDVAQKLEKLDKRTQRALVEILEASKNSAA